ncbi:hypothetical protein SSS_02670, partial [Sarcoptes scabiei]
MAKDHSNGAITVPPITKPTPSSTPLSSSSSSLSSTSNPSKTTSTWASTNLSMFSIANGWNDGVNFNISNNCAFCKNVCLEPFNSIENNSPTNTINSKNNQYFRSNCANAKGVVKMPNCKHIFHKE